MLKSRFISTLVTLAGAQIAFGQGVVGSAFADWQADHGVQWHIDVDEGTGYAEFLFGGRVNAEFTPIDEADWFTLARGMLGLAANVHGIEQTTLVEHSTQFLPLGFAGTTDKMTVKFRQMVSGVPVDGGFVNVLCDMQGNLLSVQTRALPGISGMNVTPDFDADSAAQRASAIFARAEGVDGSVSAAPELVIAQIDQDEQRIGALAWKVTVLWEKPDMDAIGFTYWLDAHTGAVLHRENAIHNFDVGGTVRTMATPGTLPDTASNPETQQVMKYARVTSSAGTVYTDANGVFNFVGATGPLSCTFTYVGTFNNVTNQSGAAYSLASSLTGTGNSVLLNPTSVDLTTAQANCFQSVNAVRDWVRSVNPSDAHADFVHTANANIASTCNAYYNGSSINFYTAGGGCANTAYSTVVAHEDGHWLNVLYGTGNGGDGMGEGNADVWAMYVYDNNIVGQNFCGTGCHVRDGLNTTPFCGDANPACYGEVHADGEPWMAAAWKVRRNLKLTLGTVPGGAVANSLFLGWMNSYNQTQIKSVIETQWLTLDDNDGNINNGTPHYTDIDNGFTAQGFPGFALIPITFANVTQVANTTNQTGPYPVSATITSNFGSSISSANLLYRAAPSGAFTTVAMVNTSGNVWSANIPGQIAPKRVYYYVQATDGLANSSTYPTGAPTTSTLNFAVGVFNQVFCDNFETANAWTVTNTSITSGAWERGDPLGTLNGAFQAQPEVDNPAGTGTLCMFTDQGTAGGTVGEADVDGGPTTLTSPPFDLSVGNGEIAYAYWLYNDDGDDSMTVQLSNNGTTWITARTFTGLDGGWVSDAIDVGSYVVPNATVRIRFNVSDNPNNSVTEAAIDDVCVSTLGPVGCQGDVAVYCTAKMTSIFCVPAIAANGIPSASAALPFDISASSVMNQKNGLLFYGYATHAGAFQGGTLCVQSPLRRTPLQPTNGSVSGSDCTGTMTYDFNARIQSGADTNLVAGQFVAAQFYFRDPGDPWTTGLTNAVSFTICP